MHFRLGSHIKGAKPGHGGLLPGAKVTTFIAEARGVAVGEDCNSPAAHSAFQGPEGMGDQRA
jgi:glutamate synthase domain-containing protein 2